jgi:hypothetical protein
LRRLSTFGSLDPAVRENVWERLLLSGNYLVRSAALFLKLELCLLVIGDERVLKRLGAYEHGRRPPIAAQQRRS